MATSHSAHLLATCPSCEGRFQATDAHLLKRVRCPRCQQTFVVNSLQVGDGPPAAGATLAVGDAATMDGSEARSESTKPAAPGHEKVIGKIGRFELREALGGGGFGMV